MNITISTFEHKFNYLGFHDVLLDDDKECGRYWYVGNDHEEDTIDLLAYYGETNSGSG